MAQEKTGRIIAITGPTASGKTRHAVSVAKSLNGEIISADSRQVYRGMNIGTGKDLSEYGNVSYHLIDIVDAGYKYNLYEFARDARIAIEDISGRGKLPVICGGTGLYLETLLNSTVLPEVPENLQLRAKLNEKSLEELKVILEGMKRLHNVTDVDSKKRAIRAIEIQSHYRDHPETEGGKRGLPLNSLIIGIDIDREERRIRISDRLKSRLEEGLLEEVSCLIAQGINPDDLIYYGLEYKFVTLHLTGKLSYLEMFEGLEIAIHQFAKRQMTWLRGMERRGHKIHWLRHDMPDDDFIARVEELYNDQTS